MLKKKIRCPRSLLFCLFVFLSQSWNLFKLLAEVRFVIIGRIIPTAVINIIAFLLTAKIFCFSRDMS